MESEPPDGGERERRPFLSPFQGCKALVVFTSQGLRPGLTTVALRAEDRKLRAIAPSGGFIPMNPDVKSGYPDLALGYIGSQLAWAGFSKATRYYRSRSLTGRKQRHMLHIHVRDLPGCGVDRYRCGCHIAAAIPADRRATRRAGRTAPGDEAVAAFHRARSNHSAY